ncbi:MAG: DegT/DnrJ/EryC1/StrS family aminotransferase [Bdellovibrionales bacterium]|nr:DegT/DnrJ/EryC1/StrS family aminotransferase [Bdellovibrionales bacterium]
MRKIPLNECTFGEDEIQAAIAVLRSGHLTMGSQCEAFENRFARELGVRNALFVNSGSSANLLAAFALVNPALQGHCPPGGEVIVPAVTWSTTIWPIVQAGLTPVLVDSDPQTFQMDLQQVKAAIGPKTVGICPVHVLGNAVPMIALQALAKQHDLWLIEDTCEALGTRHAGKDVGTFGDIGTFSFYFSHHITTIEGGMVVTDNDELAELMRCLRAHGWTRQMKGRAAMEAKHPEIDPRFLFVNTGFNLRATEINAAFGLKQIEKLRTFNKTRIRNAEFWNKEFATLIQTGYFRPMQPTEGTESTWFGYPIICKDIELRKQLGAHLEKNGIETRPVICGNLARQPAFKMIPHRIVGALKGADEIMDCGLFWGSHPVMNENDLSYVANTVKGFFKA